MALCIPFPLWQLTSYVHQDRLCLQRSSLPSSCLSITRVSALLLYEVMPHGMNFCRLLAHSLYFLITDSLPVTALFSVDVPCFILLNNYFIIPLFLSCLHIDCWSFYIIQQLCGIILHTFDQYRVKHSYYLARNRHQ